MLFEVINPSDAYTFEADSYGVAAAAGLFLGEGRYGLQEVGGEWSMPVFIFGGAIEWFDSQFGDFSAFTEANKPKIAAALDSLVIGSATERMAYDTALAEISDADRREAFKAKWHDRNRSSMNNIGARAKKLAAAIG